MSLKVLMIGSDRSLFREGSPARARAVEYGTLAEELHIVVFAKRGAGERVQLSENTFVYPTNSRHRLLYPLDAFRIARRIVSREWLVSCQDPFEAGLAGWLLKLTRKTRLQLQVHIDFYSPFFKRESWENKIRVFLAHFLLPKAHGLRVVSKDIEKYVTEKMRIPKERVAVLPIFTDVLAIAEREPHFNLHQRYQNFETIIVMVSRLVRQKNISLALEALKELVKQFPKLGLVIVGSGPEEARLKSEAARLGIKGYVVFESWAEDVASYYKTADIFLSTTNYEGWGLTTVEALAAGCPVVMTNVGCVLELLENEKNAMVIPVGDRAALVMALRRLLADTQFRKELGARGQETAIDLAGKDEYLSSYQKAWFNCMS